MFTRIYSIPYPSPGRLSIMPRPRGGEWLEAEIQRLSQSGTDVIVSLLEPKEARELDLQQENFFCEKYSIKFISYPISDYGVPEQVHSFVELIKQLDEKLRQGKNLVIHCRMGIGRSSMVAAALLVRTGMQVQEAFVVIEKVRVLKVPDTEAQVNWIKRVAALLK